MFKKFFTFAISLGLSASLFSQTVYIEASGEVPFPENVDNLTNYEGKISGDFAIKLLPGKTLGIVAGYKIDGFERNSNGVLVSEINVHNPYIGLSVNLLGNSKLLLEPYATIGYSFLKYKTENPLFVNSSENNGINIMPGLSVGFQLPSKVRVFARITQNYLFQQNAQGEYGEDPDLVYTNLGAGISLGIF